MAEPLLQGQGVAARGALLGGDAARLEGLEEEVHDLLAAVRRGRGGVLGLGRRGEAGGGQGAGGQAGPGLGQYLAPGPAAGEESGDRVEAVSLHGKISFRPRVCGRRLARTGSGQSRIWWGSENDF